MNLQNLANLGDQAIVYIDRHSVYRGEITLISKRGIDICNPEIGTKFIKWYNVKVLIKPNGQRFESTI